jgi:hypothetical protein
LGGRWTGGAPMADSSLNRRMTVRLGPSVAFAQIAICGFDGVIELEALRLYAEHTDAVLGARGFSVEELKALRAIGVLVDTRRK